MDDKMRGLMIDHIDGKLSGELEKYVLTHIDKHPEARKEYDQLKVVIEEMHAEEELEVPARGKEDFLKMLEEQQPVTPKGKVIRMESKWVARIAAAFALIVLGYAGGKWSANQQELEALRAEMEQTKQLVIVAMDNEGSASARMKGVLTSHSIAEPDMEILNALINTMNTDKNINVRVAAIEALGNFADQEEVRNALIQSLSNQEYPAVQLKLISLMVELGETRAVEPLQNLIHNDEVITVVKDEAQYGLFKLM